MSLASEYLCVALDTDSLDKAHSLLQILGKRVGFAKVGLELFSAAGPEAVRKLGTLGPGIFLDLKLHDIPNTVAGAVRQAASLGASFLTLHASGGPDMVKAAREAAEESSSALSVTRPRLLAVTVLTSLNGKILSETFGVDEPPERLVLRLAQLAKDSGADGVVCSAREAAAVKKVCGSDFFTVTPGVRPAGAQTGDQKRVTTPGEAVTAGADLLVVGRPITGARDPAAAADGILQEIEEALQ